MSTFLTILEYILLWLSVILMVLLSVAIFTLLERQVLGAMQRRQGPQILGFFGILQPIADGVKLILKETVIPVSSDILIFIFAPIFTFALALCLWPVIPFDYGYVLANFDFGILYIFTVSSLSVHSVIMAGWSSNSKYAFLGAVRSAAQMISYEVSFGVTIVSVILLSRSLNLSEIVLQQKQIWNMWPLFPMFIIFFICALAETNRHPFDLPEAESELVSGYNVEYAAVGFALFFLAEYSNIMIMSVLTAIFFTGGWIPLIDLPFIPDFVWMIGKTMFFIYLFIFARGTLPRYRYDQLMRLGWKIFLPISLAFVMILASWLISFNHCYSYLV